MAAGKKGSSGPASTVIPPVVDKGFRWLIGPGRPAGLLVLIAGLLLGAWYFAWRSVGRWMLSQREYLLSVEKIEITPPPKWIQTSDVRAEAFLYACLEDSDRLSIMDDDLVERIGKAFSLHPWVAKVVSVRKFHPARVQVELVYRRPVCMVQVQDDPPSAWVPVDPEGTILPGEDFTPQEKRPYPRLTGIETRPLAPPGVRWADPRVSGAAEIAAALKPSWERMGLDRIMALPTGLPEHAGGPSSRFVVATRGGTRIDWGRASNGQMLGEAPASEKVARLEQYFKDHGTLEGPSGRAQRLDLTRTGPIEANRSPDELGLPKPQQ